MEEKKNLWSSYDEAAKKELHEINEKYKACLDAGKTERECVKLAVEMAKEAGYQDIKDVLKEGKPTLVGASTGLVVGLVAITPGAGFVPIWSSFIIGALVSPICYFGVGFIKERVN